MYIDNFGILKSKEYKNLKLACMLQHISNTDVELYVQYRINEVYNAIWRHLRCSCTHGVNKYYYTRNEYNNAVKQVSFAYAVWNVDNIVTYLLSNGYISMSVMGFALQRDEQVLSEEQMQRIRGIEKIVYCNIA